MKRLIAGTKIKKNDIFVIDGHIKQIYYARRATKKDDKWLFRFFKADKDYLGGETMVKYNKNIIKFKEIKII